MVGESGKSGQKSAVFQGVYPARLDDKGRVPIPSQLRASLEADAALMITIFGVAGSRCLQAYPLPAWEEFVTEFQANTDPFSAKRQHFQAVYIGSAAHCQLDRQGRVLIPQTLRGLAELDHEVQIVGVGSTLQIFSKEGYARVVTRFLEKFADPDGDGFGGMSQ
jgi:MraZ protein